jgi:hypothetical protein
MIDEPWNLQELEPGEALDRRVRRGMGAAAKRRSSSRQSSPVARSGPARGGARFFPLERAIYVVVLAVYAVYAGARAVRVFQEARASEVLPGFASSARSGGAPIA